MSHRIAIDGRVLDDRYPGIGRYVYNLAGALAEVDRDEEILLLTSPDVSRSRFDVSRLVDRGIQTVEIGPLRAAWADLALAKTLTAIRADLFHSTYFVAALGLKCPRIATIYDLIPGKSPSVRSPIRRGLWHLAMRRALSSAHLLTLSEAVRSELVERGVSAEKITVTPPAADPLFSASRQANGPDRSHLNLPERFALWVGTNKPHKNLRSLAEAWRTVEREEPGIWLIAVGSVDSRFPSLQELADRADLSRVRSLGVVDDSSLSEIYRAAECVVQPSLQEGLGFPVLEAKACGARIVCADIPALREVGGDQACYFDPLDTDGMASAILSTVETATRQTTAHGLPGADARQLAATLTLSAYRTVLDSVSRRPAAG